MLGFSRSGKLKVPDYVDIVKTGSFKELAPVDPDWFYTRCAAIARVIYVRGPRGVGALRKAFGGKHRRGVKPSHFAPAGKNVVRKALQALEQLKWIEKDANGGRRLASQGNRDLDRLANQVAAQAKTQATLEAVQAAAE